MDKSFFTQILVSSESKKTMLTWLIYVLGFFCVFYIICCFYAIHVEKNGFGPILFLSLEKEMVDKKSKVPGYRVFVDRFNIHKNHEIFGQRITNQEYFILTQPDDKRRISAFHSTFGQQKPDTIPIFQIKTMEYKQSSGNRILWGIDWYQNNIFSSMQQYWIEKNAFKLCSFDSSNEKCSDSVEFVNIHFNEVFGINGVHVMQDKKNGQTHAYLIEYTGDLLEAPISSSNQKKGPSIQSPDVLPMKSDHRDIFIKRCDTLYAFQGLDFFEKDNMFITINSIKKTLYFCELGDNHWESIMLSKFHGMDSTTNYQSPAIVNKSDTSFYLFLTAVNENITIIEFKKISDLKNATPDRAYHISVPYKTNESFYLEGIDACAGPHERLLIIDRFGRLYYLNKFAKYLNQSNEPINWRELIIPNQGQPVHGQDLAVDDRGGVWLATNNSVRYLHPELFEDLYYFSNKLYRIWQIVASIAFCLMSILLYERKIANKEILMKRKIANKEILIKKIKAAFVQIAAELSAILGESREIIIDGKNLDESITSGIDTFKNKRDAIFSKIDKLERKNKEFEEVFKIKTSNEKRDSEDSFDANDPFPRLISNSRSMRELKELIKHLATEEDGPVLLLGEKGVGKSLIAEMIKSYCNRSGPFIKVNAAHFDPSLIESELFGYAPGGAFTGANRKGKIGLIQKHDKGIIFLDEIDALPLTCRKKLNVYLDDKSFLPVGGEEIHQSDVRIIAATNIDLNSAILEGTFDESLLDRLGIPIEIPPLRDRKEDILLIADSYLKKLGVFDMTPTAKEKLYEYYYPGNIRELINTLKRAKTLAKKSNYNDPHIVITSDHILFRSTGQTHQKKTEKISKEDLKNENIQEWIDIFIKYQWEIGRILKDRHQFPKAKQLKQAQLYNLRLKCASAIIAKLKNRNVPNIEKVLDEYQMPKKFIMSLKKINHF